MAAGAVVALASLGVGCEGDALSATAQIAVSPARVDFGAVASGSVRSARIVIENTAPSGALALGRIALADGGDPAFQVSEAPRELAPGARAEVEIRYAADADREADGAELVVDSSATNAPRVVVPLSADATAPELRVDAERLDLGTLADGVRRTAILVITNHGLAPLHLSALSLATLGFAGEACRDDDDCREGRCAGEGPRRCALACTGGAACPGGTRCARDPSAGEVCVGLEAPRALRGFSVEALELGLTTIGPGARRGIEVVYAPAPTDRGRADLVIESDDPTRPLLRVPLSGRPDDLPPTAAARRVDAAVVEPGARVDLDGSASRDPEGTALTYAWRFRLRPEGSLARLEDAAAARARFVVDRPGAYVVELEVRDALGQRSANAAELTIAAAAGRSMRATLTWDRADAVLGLHLASPGAAFDTVGDCFADNPRPDWGPSGPAGDPTFTARAREESIALVDPADGVYALAARVRAASPAGPTTATVVLHYLDVEVARFEATLDAGQTHWDVATVSRPSGQIVPLGAVR